MGRNSWEHIYGVCCDAAGHQEWRRMGLRRVARWARVATPAGRLQLPAVVMSHRCAVIYLSGSVAGTGGRMEGSTPASGGMVIGVCMSGKEKGRSPGALPPGEE